MDPIVQLAKTWRQGSAGARLNARLRAWAADEPSLVRFAGSAERLFRFLRSEPSAERDRVFCALLRQAGLPSDRVFAARGCARCNGTGRRGRVAAFELLIPTEELRSAIERGAKIEETREIAARGGIVALREATLRLASEGITTVQDVVSRLPASGA